MKIRKLTLLIALLLLLTACETRILGIPVGLRPRATATLEETSKTPTTAPTATSAPSPTPDDEITGLEHAICIDGNLTGQVWVRDCPGINCPTIGTLSTGDVIETTGTRKDEKTSNTTWLELTAPIEGWVSIRYVCQKGSD